MYTWFSRWLCQIADNIKISADDIETRSFAYWAKAMLFEFAGSIDAVARFFLRIRAKCSWRYDQLRSHFVKNEFDSSLDMNVMTLIDLNDEDRKRYTEDLIKRRRVAHLRDLEGG